MMSQTPPIQDIPRVSVIVPTLNRAEFLPRTLASVFSQTLPVHEVFLVDDGSTDDTAAIVEQCCAAIPGCAAKLQYWRQTNQGKSVALNAALTKVTGDWIAFEDSDDPWLPDKLEWQFKALHAFPDCGACFTDADFINVPHIKTSAFKYFGQPHTDLIGKIQSGVDYILDLPHHSIYMQTIVVRRDVMDRVGEFDPRLRAGQDKDFIFRLVRETSLCYVNRPLIQIDRAPQRRVGLMTEFSPGSAGRLAAEVYTYEKWLRLYGRDTSVTGKIRSRLGTLRGRLGDVMLLQGDVRAARRLAWAAIDASRTPRLIGKCAYVWLLPGLRTRQLRQRFRGAIKG